MTFCASCTKKTENFASFPFRANPALLGTPQKIEALALEITPPKEWSRLDSAEAYQFQKLLMATELKQKFRETKVHEAFLDLQSSSMFYISEFASDSFPIAAVAAQYYEFLRARPGISELSNNVYAINELPVYYFRVHSMTTINYKLLGESESGRRFLIEYVIGDETHTKVKDAVESSMATLKQF